MAEWTRWFLGLDDSPDWISGGDWYLECGALPYGHWAALCVFGMLAAILGTWTLYQKEGRGIGLLPSLLMTSLRLLLFSLIAVMLLEVVLVIQKMESVPSHLMVLIDTSESMGLKDPYTDQSSAVAIAKGLDLKKESGQPDIGTVRDSTRLHLTQQAFGRIAKPLGQGRLLSQYRFANQLESLDGQTELQPLDPAGSSTNIGTAIKGVLAAHRGQPVSGILLITDGRSNSGDDPLRIAAQAEKQDIPIQILAAGTAEGPRNLRIIDDLEISPILLIHDPSEVSVLLESHGMKEEVTTLFLEQRQEGGSWSPLGHQVVTLGESGVLQRVTFKITPQSTGTFDLRARVEDMGPELTKTDNVGSASFRVIHQRIRVLLISGTPSNEFQFLRNAMLRDASIEFASWLQSAGPDYEQVGSRSVRRLPKTQKELNRFDVLILLDPDFRKWDAGWSKRLIRFVGQAGGGLVYVAGESFTPQLFTPGLNGNAMDSNRWIKCLPVTRDPGLYSTAAQVALSQQQTWRFELTPQGERESIFHFVPNPEKNRRVLASLPGMYWHFPVTRSKPGATVLARHGDPRMRNTFGRHVLIATHLYGPGRTVFIGFDSTFRWRYLDDAHFDGFWTRLVDRVGRSKLLGGRYPYTLETNKSLYRVGDRVTLTARFNDSEDLSDGTMSLNGQLEAAGELMSEFSLQPRSEELGVFETTFVAEAMGPHLVRVLPSAESLEDSGSQAATLKFRVEPPKQEFDNPTWNRPLLEDMARATGGQVFTLANSDDIPNAFPVSHVERMLEYRDELWDAPILFCGVVLLLTLEWVLRKRYRMA